MGSSNATARTSLLSSPPTTTPVTSSSPTYPRCLDALDVKGLKVLEIGLGQGAESEQLIRRGARWTGLDLTSESVRRVQIRLELHDLDYDDIWQGSATHIPADDASFDLVFSHGVLHHVPDILAAQAEVQRILSPADVWSSCSTPAGL